jgi:hypothetical protein
MAALEASVKAARQDKGKSEDSKSNGKKTPAKPKAKAKPKTKAKA